MGWLRGSYVGDAPGGPGLRGQPGLSWSAGPKLLHWHARVECRVRWLRRCGARRLLSGCPRPCMLCARADLGRQQFWPRAAASAGRAAGGGGAGRPRAARLPRHHGPGAGLSLGRRGRAPVLRAQRLPDHGHPARVPGRGRARRGQLGPGAPALLRAPGPAHLSDLLRRPGRGRPARRAARARGLALAGRPSRPTSTWPWLGHWSGLVNHLWTLAVEEQFYLVWPWVALFAPRRWLLAILLAAVAAAPLWRIAGLATGISAFAIEMVSLGAFDSLAMGALLAALRHEAFGGARAHARLRALCLFGGGPLLAAALGASRSRLGPRLSSGVLAPRHGALLHLDRGSRGGRLRRCPGPLPGMGAAALPGEGSATASTSTTSSCAARCGRW